MKKLSHDEIQVIADRLKYEIKALPLVSIGFSTGLLLSSSFNCASLAYKMARDRITLNDVIAEAHSSMESVMRSRCYNYRQNNEFKIMYYGGYEPSECLTGSSFHYSVG